VSTKMLTDNTVISQHWA